MSDSRIPMSEYLMAYLRAVKAYLKNLKDRNLYLENKNLALECRVKELNIELMRKSAEASEAQETLDRWQTEIKILRDQKGHNLCHLGIPRLLKATLGDPSPYPDPECITAEEFAAGCVEYHAGLFKDCPIRLVVQKLDQNLSNV